MKSPSQEALALVWACDKLHGLSTACLVTDHKPLEMIYGSCSKSCARIEHWVLCMQPYNYHVVRFVFREQASNIADPQS